jgi:hypothetical protein
MTASQELALLIKKRDAVVSEMAANLFAELQARTPVDTGTLKSAWEMTKIGDGWLFSNNMNYADFILRGIRTVTFTTKKGTKVTKTIGSKQLPDGVYPILQDFNKELQIRLDMIK